MKVFILMFMSRRSYDISRRSYDIPRRSYDIPQRSYDILRSNSQNVFTSLYSYKHHQIKYFITFTD